MDQGIISAFKRIYKTSVLDAVEKLLPVRNGRKT